MIRSAGRKGWLPAFRDATLFKVAYAYGLRRNEVRMLDAADFGRNPHAPEFGEYGVCYVRHGKASCRCCPITASETGSQLAGRRRIR